MFNPAKNPFLPIFPAIFAGNIFEPLLTKKGNWTSEEFYKKDKIHEYEEWRGVEQQHRGKHWKY